MIFRGARVNGVCGQPFQKQVEKGVLIETRMAELEDGFTTEDVDVTISGSSQQKDALKMFIRAVSPSKSRSRRAS